MARALTPACRLCAHWFRVWLLNAAGVTACYAARCGWTRLAARWTTGKKTSETCSPHLISYRGTTLCGTGSSGKLLTARDVRIPLLRIVFVPALRRAAFCLSTLYGRDAFCIPSLFRVAGAGWACVQNGMTARILLCARLCAC